DPDNPYRYLGIQGRVVDMTETGGDAHIDKMAKKYLDKDTYPYRTAGEVRVNEVTPSPMASQWGAEAGKDPRVIEVILRQSRRIVRMDRGILIAETHHGFVCANAGVDAANVEP